MTFILKFTNYIKRRINTYNTYKETMNDLYNFSDQELKDIGINRSLIQRVAMDVYSDVK